MIPSYTFLPRASAAECGSYVCHGKVGSYLADSGDAERRASLLLGAFAEGAALRGLRDGLLGFPLRPTGLSRLLRLGVRDLLHTQ